MLAIKNRRLKILKSILLVIFILYFLPGNQNYGYSQVYLDSSAAINDRVNDLLGRMTIDEKIGQMLQTERSLSGVNSKIKTLFLGSILSGGGSVPSNNSPEGWVSMYNGFQDSALATRLKIPIIYGIDAVHGHNNAYGAVIFPHNIGLGCTRDSELVELCEQATAVEVRATGLNWTFSPCIAVPRDIRWGRTYEGFGETPELQQTMAYAAVKGYQGDSLGIPLRILACAKHYVGDGGTTGGINAGNTQITEQELRAIHLPGYIKAIQAGVGSIMISYSSWNGVKCHGDKYLITDLLKNELGFKGFVVSDWEGINQLSPDLKTAVDSGVNAGIDMIMEPYIPDSIIADLKELVSDGKVTEARIDDAVKRILTVKFRLGIFEHPYASLSLADSLGNDYHRSIARRAVRESQVLLKNNNRLIPLSKTSGKILVAGSKANDIGSQCGGWTLTWQGMTGNFIPGTTILDAIKTVRDSDNVIYSSNGSTTSNVDVAVVVVGETPYAEGYGDNSILNLSSSDLNTITNVKNLNIPYVVILLSGRPLMIESTINDADAFIASWLPGTEAMGITDVLFGDYLFTGKLSHTWPVSISQVPINFNDSPYNPLFPYDYGLTGNEPVNIDNTVISNVTVFPNPASKIININCASQISGIRIYNLQGVLVYSGNNYSENEHFSVNISELKSGAYCLVILGNNREKSFSVLFNKQ